MRVLLTDPQLINVEINNLDRFPNLGIIALIGYAKQKFKNDIFLYTPSTSEKEFKLRLINFKPEIIGISFSSIFKEETYKTIKLVKSFFPDIPIILGGAGPSAEPEKVLKESNADIAVIGEGEKTFVELLNYFKGNITKLSEIEGITYKLLDKVVTKFPSPFLDLKKLSLPGWEYVDLKNFSGMSPCKKLPSTMISVTRGCPFNCVFCSNPVWRSSRPRVRIKSAQQVIQEINILRNRGINEIRLGGDELNFNLDESIALFHKIGDQNFQNLYFSCNLRADKINEPFVKAMKRANVWLVNIGIESFCNEVLKGIKKNVTSSDIMQAISLLRKHRIKVYGNMMLYNFWEENQILKIQTHEQVKADLKHVFKLIILKKINYVSASFATPIPGSELFQISLKHKLIGQQEISDADKAWNPIGFSNQRKMIFQRNLYFLLQFLSYLLNGGINIRHFGRAIKKTKYIFSYK